MKNRITEEEAKEVFNDDFRKREAEEILKDESKVDALIKNVVESLENIPLIGKFFSVVPALCLLLKDYVSGKYNAVPIASVITIVIALVYFVSPIDLVPDFIPIAGKLDDALVIAIAVGSIHNDLADYREWKGLSASKVLDVSDLLSK